MHLHCVQYVQIRSFFWVVFSSIRTAEYREILRISPYSFQMRENTDQKNLHLWTLFTQFYFNRSMPGGSKRSKTHKQTSSQKMLFISCIYHLFLQPGMGLLKGRTAKEKSFQFINNSDKCRFTVTRIGHFLNPPKSFLFQTKKKKRQTYRAREIMCNLLKL